MKTEQVMRVVKHIQRGAVMSSQPFFEGECPRDYKKKHFPERLGVDGGFIIWQCMQCKKIEKVRYEK